MSRRGIVIPLHPPADPTPSAIRDRACGTGNESVDVETVAAAAVGADQLPPVLLRLEDVRHAQALRACRGQDGLAALPGLAPLRGLVQGADDLRLDRGPSRKRKPLQRTSW